MKSYNKILSEASMLVTNYKLPEAFKLLQESFKDINSIDEESIYANTNEIFAAYKTNEELRNYLNQFTDRPMLVTELLKNLTHDDLLYIVKNGFVYNVAVSDLKYTIGEVDEFLSNEEEILNKSKKAKKKSS